MPSRTRQATQPESGGDAPPKRGRGRPPKPFEELSDDGRRKRLMRMGDKAAAAPGLKAVPLAPAPERKPAAPPEVDNLPPIAIRDDIDVHEFMRRAMLGLINPTARQMIAARALMALALKEPERGSGAGAEPGKKEQQADAARTAASGSRFAPTPPPTRLRAA